MDNIRALQSPVLLRLNIFKVLFPTVSILIFFLILLSIRSVPETEYFSKNIPLDDKSNSIDINKGEIFGLTEKKDSFYFTSSKIAYTNLIDSTGYTLVLDNLVGQIEYSKEDVLFAKSPKAEYLFKEKRINSVNNVFYNKDESVYGKSVNLEIYLNKGTVESNGPSLVSGPNFFITAKYLSFVNPKIKEIKNKMVLHFNQDVNAFFYPSR